MPHTLTFKTLPVVTMVLPVKVGLWVTTGNPQGSGNKVRSSVMTTPNSFTKSVEKPFTHFSKKPPVSHLLTKNPYLSPKGGSKIYWNRGRATRFFWGSEKKSAPPWFFSFKKNFLPRDFFPLKKTHCPVIFSIKKNSLPRDFLFQRNSLPRDFFLRKKSKPGQHSQQKWLRTMIFS